MLEFCSTNVVCLFICPIACAIVYEAVGYFSLCVVV